MTVTVLLDATSVLVDVVPPHIGKAIDRHLMTVRDFVTKHGGSRSVPLAKWFDRTARRSLGGLAADESFRSIAARLGLAPSMCSLVLLTTLDIVGLLDELDVLEREADWGRADS